MISPATTMPTVSRLADQLAQVFHDILENAVRYADPGARLRVGSRRHGQSVEIVFEDSGPSVPEESLSRPFERFCH